MPEAVAALVAEFVAFDLAAGALATAVASNVAYAATAIAISEAANSLMATRSSGQGGTVSNQQLSTTVRQAAASRRLIYGRVKAGGLLAYPAQSVDGKYADLAIILGEGQLQGIGNVAWLGDELSSDSKFSGLITTTFYSGGPGQVASAALISASDGEWTSAHVGNGIAWVHLRYEFSRNAFPRGLILPAFEVFGRLCFDPRTNTRIFTSNPALIRLDHLRSEYGPSSGVPDAWIDFSSFAAAANLCDEILESIDPANVVASVPNRIRRYEFNGVFEVSASASQIGETLDAAMAGKTLIVNGKYRCYPGAYRAATGPTLTSEYLTGSIGYRPHQTRSQRINTARGTYREPKQDWQSPDYHEQQLSQAVIAEAGEIVQTMNFPGTTQGAMAQRLARIAMNKSRSAVPMVLECNYAALAWRLWDVVSVSLPEVGASGSWLIVGYTYTVSGGIRMTLVPHLASDYEWIPSLHEKLVKLVVRPNFNISPPALTGLTVTDEVLVSGDFDSAYGIKAVWTPTAYVSAEFIEIEHKPSASSEWIAGERVAASATSWQKQLTPGLAYDVRARIIARDGRFGVWSTVNNTLVTGGASAPADPVAISVTGTGTHTITWRNPVNADVLRARVFVSGTNNSATSTQIAEIFGLPDTQYSTTYAIGGVPRHYWVKSVNRVGLTSNFVYIGVGN